MLSFLLFDGMGMRRGRGSRRRSATLKKSPGIGGRNFILLSVEGVAQGELNAAFLGGQGKTFRVIRRNEKRDDGRILRIACRIPLETLAGGNYGDILQYGSGLTFGATFWRTGQENIYACAGPDEARNGDDFIHAYGYGAHTRRDEGR